jgi:hypothetical protein
MSISALSGRAASRQLVHPVARPARASAHPAEHPPVGEAEWARAISFLTKASLKARCGFPLQAFRFFDRDGNGSISTAEFESVMTELGEDRLTQEECSLFIKLIDKDGDHEVSGPTGRERLVSPTLHTLQDPILLTPLVCFRGAKPLTLVEL